MRNKKTIKEFRAFYIMASSVYAKSSRKRKSGVIVQCNKKHGRPMKVTLYLIRLLAAVQAAELQIDTAGSI